MTLTLSKEHLGSACELKTRQNHFLCRGRIIEIAVSHIKLDNEREALPILALDTEVKLNIFAQKEKYLSLMGKVYISTPQFMIIREPRPLTESEKRAYYRVNVEMKCEIDPVPLDTDEMAEEKVLLKNISLGGLLMGSGQTLKTGQIFVAKLELPKGMIEIACVVRRLESKDRLLNWYGCQFLESDARKQDMIWHYILLLQQEEIRLQKEKRG